MCCFIQYIVLYASFCAPYISLGYTFPKKWLNAVKIDRMRVYFTANNPFIFTKCDYLKNYDPEKGGNDDDAPLSKQYVFGVNISF